MPFHSLVLSVHFDLIRRTFLADAHSVLVVQNILLTRNHDGRLKRLKRMP